MTFLYFFPLSAGLLALTSTTNTLLIAILIPILGFVSPLLIARQINANARKTKVLDWEREDAVAAKAEAVAEKAADRQIAIDKKTEEVARLLAVSTNNTTTKLEQIHGLVNSQMTEAIRHELAATKDTLAMMSELMAANKKNGVEASMQMVSAFRGREEAVAKLEQQLTAREEADAASKLVNTGPREVIIMNPDPVPVVDATPPKDSAQEVVIVNPDPVPVLPVTDDTKEDSSGS